MSSVPNFRRSDGARARIDEAIAGELPPLPRVEACTRAERLLMGETTAPEVEYPVAALGPLADVARAIAEGGQVAPEMAGQSVLATAALLTQSTANVRSLDGHVKPLSIYALTVAHSGDGKDTSERVALSRVHEYQREQGAAYHQMVAEHEREMATRKKADPLPEPLPPAPYRIAGDITVEGLRRSFVEGVASQGTFTTEAGVILAGHAMSNDHRTKTAAALCRLWDVGHLSVVRGGAPRVERYGQRLSMHLLAQPAALGDVVDDPNLSEIGLWPRFLIAWPAPLAPRVYRRWIPRDNPTVQAYWGRCNELLEAPVPHDCDDLHVIELDDTAHRHMVRYFESMEREARRGDLRDVKPFALRATEMACRVSGVLAAFDHQDAIGADIARGACELVSYSLEAWSAAKAGKADPVPGYAMSLYRWLAERPEPVPMRDVLRQGPMMVRHKDRRDAALERLRALGLADVTDGVAVALGVDHAGA